MAWDGWSGRAHGWASPRKVWSDHTDIRPTLLDLVGLQDDYVHDGLPLYQFTNSKGSDSDARPRPRASTGS